MLRTPASTARRIVPLFVALLWAGACDDDFFTIRWELSPDTVALYSLARPELNLASGFSFNDRFKVEIEGQNASGTWDVAVDTQNGQMVWVTPRLLGIESEAGITPVDGSSFESLTRAPGDTILYYNTVPVPIRVGQLYAVRTFEAPGLYGQPCNYFGKVEVLSLDPVVGTVEFRYDSSPVCNDRELIPPN